MNLKEIENFEKIFKKLTNIVESDLDWDVKFDLVFSKNISQKMLSIYSFEWYDPDTSYCEDVMAFYRAAKEKNESLQKVKEVIYES